MSIAFAEINASLGTELPEERRPNPGLRRSLPSACLYPPGISEELKDPDEVRVASTLKLETARLVALVTRFSLDAARQPARDLAA